MPNEIGSKRHGLVLEITLNRPGRGNAVTPDMAVELARLVGEAADDTALIVLRGGGEDFCVGREQTGLTESGAFNVEKALYDALEAIQRSPVPVLAVVQGRAFGFGCSLAALCDITLASHSATFKVPEMTHKILPTMAVPAFVDRISRKAFTYFVYGTAVMSAERALSFGMVSDVLPAEGLERAVQALAEAALAMSMTTNRAIKAYARHAFDTPSAGAVQFSRDIRAAITLSAT